MTGENGYVHPMNVPSQAIPNDDSFSMNGIYKPRNDWLGSLGHVVEHSLDGDEAGRAGSFIGDLIERLRGAGHLGSRAGPNALAVAAEIPCLWKLGRTAIGARPAPPPSDGGEEDVADDLADRADAIQNLAA
jgi:hypothetical protein